MGTSGNDTFIAGDEGGAATLNAGDAIDGAAGTDTLKLFNAAGALNAANFGVAVISNVENVEATLSASAQVLDVSGNTGVTKVSLVNGFDGVVTLKAAQIAGLTGTVNTTGAATSFAFSDVTGGADSVTLELNAAALVDNAGVGTKGLTIAGVETLNIAATGVNALGDTTLAATTKIVVTGAGSLTTKLISGLAKTIDGSAATGNLTINNAAAAAAVQNIKTGTGNDTYTTVYANLTADDAIDLGTGTDSLRFSDSATFNNATTKAFLTKVTGVEQLGVVTTGTTLTVDGDFVSQTSYHVAGATANAVLNNVANTADVNFGVTDVITNVTGVNTVAMKLGASSLSVNLTGTKTAASVVGGVVATVGDGLAVTGSSTINVKSSGVSGAANNVLDLKAADNQSVVVTGSQNLTLRATNDVSTTGFSINASDFTGKLTVTGTNDTDTIKGGSGNDTIDGGMGTSAVVAVAQVGTITFGGTEVTGTNDVLTTTITDAGGTSTFTTTVTAGTAATAATTVVSVVTKVNSTGTYTVSEAAGVVTITSATAGTAFTEATVLTTGTANEISIGAYVPVTANVAAVTATGFAADTMTGNGGADKFIISTLLSATPVVGEADVITDFVSGTDTLSFLNITGAANVAATSTNYAEGTAAVATFTAALSAANTQCDTTVLYSVQQVGSDSFVFFDGSGDGSITNAAGDYIVQLTGVALTGIALADIVA